MKQQLLSLRAWCAGHRFHLIIWGCVLGGFGLGHALVYQRPVTFNYSGSNCFRDITFLPGLLRTSGQDDYRLVPGGVKKVGGRAVLSTQTCLQATQAPQGNSFQSVRMALGPLPLPGKQFGIKTPPLAQLNEDSLGPKISIREPITVGLSQEDKTFAYKAHIGEKETACQQTNQQLACDVQQLGLIQNQRYTLAIQRYFNNRAVGKVLQKDLQTTDPVAVMSTSVAPGEIVFGKPQSFTVEASRALQSADIKLELIEEGRAISVPQNLHTDGQKAVITLSQPLQRRSTYQLKINDLEAQDKGVLLTPQMFQFTTSGGPKVAGANIGHHSVPDGKAMVIRFDQPLKAEQEAAAHVAVSLRGSPTSVQATIDNNGHLVIRPQASWGICTPFTIKLGNGLLSAYDISGDSEWQLNSRTLCYTITTIGYSAAGRPIQAWRFGNGSHKALFVAATHGNEQGTRLLLQEWIRELDANPTRIPANKTIIIIPSVNPDGLAANSRLNARGVDLNRNFPANDWKSDVTMPGGGGVVKGGAGSAPLSEPESKTLASFVLSERPALVLTYHSVASVVSGNDSGYSNDLARRYATQSKYRYLPKAHTGQVFKYDTTGAFEDWLHDKHGLPCILIETGSDQRSEFTKNRPAMWTIISSF